MKRQEVPLNLGASFSKVLAEAQAGDGMTAFKANQMNKEIAEASKLDDISSMVPSSVGEIKGLHLTHCHLGDQAFILMLSGLSSDHGYNAFFLSHNRLGKDAIEALKQFLKQDQSVKHLILSHNEITPFAAAGLADLLKVNHEIGWLILSHNAISDVGVSALSEGLEKNRGVKHLILDHNRISDQGAESLAKILPSSSLKTIVLSDNSITDRGARAFLNAFHKNDSLSKLDLRNNPISHDMKVRFRRELDKKGFILHV